MFACIDTDFAIYFFVAFFEIYEFIQFSNVGNIWQTFSEIVAEWANVCQIAKEGNIFMGETLAN